MINTWEKDFCRCTCSMTRCYMCLCWRAPSCHLSNVKTKENKHQLPTVVSRFIFAHSCAASLGQEHLWWFKSSRAVSPRNPWTLPKATTSKLEDLTCWNAPKWTGSVPKEVNNWWFCMLMVRLFELIPQLTMIYLHNFWCFLENVIFFWTFLGLNFHNSYTLFSTFIFNPPNRVRSIGGSVARTLTGLRSNNPGTIQCPYRTISIKETKSPPSANTIEIHVPFLVNFWMVFSLVGNFKTQTNMGPKTWSAWPC